MFVQIPRYQVDVERTDLLIGTPHPGYKTGRAMTVSEFQNLVSEALAGLHPDSEIVGFGSTHQGDFGAVVLEVRPPGWSVRRRL